MRLFIAGEGKTELGSWASEKAYQPSAEHPGDRGMIAALLSRAGLVYGALEWKRIRKYRAGDHRSAEHKTVLGLALHASEAHADALVFMRDRDGDEGRQRELEAGLVEAAQKHSELELVGGIVIEEAEAWILLLLGDARAEQHRDPKTVLEQRGISGVAAMIDVIEKAELATLNRGTALGGWLARVEELKKGTDQA